MTGKSHLLNSTILCHTWGLSSVLVSRPVGDKNKQTKTDFHTTATPAGLAIAVCLPIPLNPLSCSQDADTGPLPMSLAHSQGSSLKLIFPCSLSKPLTLALASPLHRRGSKTTSPQGLLPTLPCTPCFNFLPQHPTSSPDVPGEVSCLYRCS